ncbi:MAG: hypothetical protein IKL82_00910 [Clostridia bacterium]|nr:hypothetical protein [Clostridia bacterium]
MIRDEFLKNEMGLTPKELKGVKEKGERAYFSSEIMSLTSLVKTFNFSLLVIAVMALAATAILVYVLFDGDFKLTGEFIAFLIVDGVMVLLLIGWFFIGRPLINKKIKRYKSIMQEITEQEMLKNTKIFKNVKR